jgi:hypothetical protein
VINVQDLRLTEGLVSIINLKFEYLKKVSDKDLFLEIIPLYKFLLSTPQVIGIIQKSNIEFQNEINQFKIVEQEVQLEIKKLKDTLVSMYPELDDSDYVVTPMSIEIGNFTPDINYQFTFKRFENLLNGILEGFDLGTPIESPGRYNNQSNIQKALDILISKYQQKRQELDNGQDLQEGVISFYLNLQNVVNRYNYAYKKLINYQRVSFAMSMHFIECLVKEINPQPQIYNTVEDLMGSPQSYILRPFAFEPARKTVYEGMIPSAEFVEGVREHLERVHSGILTGITQNLLYEQVISKYKTRCMWYDKERVRSLLLDQDGQLVRQKEDTLVKEMARYLFDNGYPVLFHIQTENLQTDLMDPSQKYPLLIEGKAYSDSAKGDLIKGIAQLHGYMNNFETTHYYIPDAYFVVFRISGPVYDFPREVLTNRYRIIPVIIDIGDSTVSGSRQQNQPVTISHEEIIHQIEVDES